MNRLLFIISLEVAMFAMARPVFAQNDSQESEVEQLYDRFEQDDNSRAQKRADEQKQERQKAKAAKPNITTLSELGKLAPFDDVAVIERRYLPKTGRFELSAAGLTGLNNPFYNNLGVSAKAAYYFHEKYGIELIYLYLSSAARQVTSNLDQNRHIATSSFVSPTGFYGAAFKWNPIYGKITFLNNKIVPFDMDFSLGFGSTSTVNSGSNPTLHLSTSQSYAITKSWAFHWDLNWNFYRANSKLSDGTTSTGTQNDLLLALGFSFFFPEATYR